MIKFKTKKVKNTFLDISPVLLLIAADANLFMINKGYKGITITEAKTTLIHDMKVGRRHRGHREGRSIDVRTRTFLERDIQDLIEYLDLKYNHYAAISSETGLKSLIVYGDDRHKDHMHIQIHPDFGPENGNI